jgi:hypothetical protein
MLQDDLVLADMPLNTWNGMPYSSSMSGAPTGLQNDCARSLAGC